MPFRDHVRLTARGAAADEGKFDRSYVPAGYRFSFSLALWSMRTEGDLAWKRLLGLVDHPGFRLGGATRRGYGGLKRVGKLRQKEFDLSTKEGLKAYSDVPGTFDVKHDGLEPFDAHVEAHAWVTATIKLTPEDFWRVGTGDIPLGKRRKPADMLPRTESIVVWNGDRGALGARHLVLPGSSIKGAIAHRTAYHYHRLANAFQGSKSDYDPTLDCPGVKSLFGYAKDNDKTNRGQVGAVVFDDVYLKWEPKDIASVMHNGIDRFTGGVRDGVLFSEELVWKLPAWVRIAIDGERAGSDEVAKRAREALCLALDDLTKGRLPLGAGSSRGHGYFRGTVAGDQSGVKWTNEA